MKTARELDQFYTSPAVAKACMQFLSKHVPQQLTDQFLEPSAGTGAFFTLAPKNRRLGFDLEPKCADVVMANFLEGEFPELVRVENGPRWVTIGNPPFGKNSSLAVAFFERAAQFSEVIAFIVPMTFRKASVQKRLNREFHLQHEMPLTGHAFIFEGMPYAVPCTFQIWVRDSSCLRHTIEAPLTHPDFEFCDPSVANFAVRRVGGLAGKVIMDFQAYSPSSHYYIRSLIGAKRLTSRFESLEWDDVKWNTAGNPSISKRELVAKYSEAVTAIRLAA